MKEGFAECANKVIMGAQQEAHLLGHKYISTEHILLALIAEAGGFAAKALQSAKLDLSVIKEQAEKLFGRGGGCSGSFSMELRFTHGAKRVLELSRDEAHQRRHAYIEAKDLFLGLLKGCDGEITRLLQSQGADVNNIKDQVIRHMAAEDEKCGSLKDQPRHGSSNNNDKQKPTVNLSQNKTNQMPAPSVSLKNETASKKVDKKVQTPTLDMFGTNLTKLAQEGKLHPLVGRQEEVERTIQIFCRRMKNNPCLVGEPGVGKTAIIEGFAQRILSGSAPAKLRGKKVIKLNMTELFYGPSCQNRPDERIRSLIKEIKESEDVILFIKQVGTLFNETSTEIRNASYILKQALGNGVIQCISSTTVNEHRQSIETDAVLRKICQTIVVSEPSIAETVKILKGLCGMYGTHHKVRYTYEALEAAAKLSHKYIGGRFLPDKAIDLIDEAGSRVQHFPKQDKRKCSINFLEVTKSDIQHMVSSWTGIPVSDVSKEEGERLLKLEQMLQSNVIGQNGAINSICRAIRRARLGLGHTTKPIASFMFIGASGVGKTELAKALAGSYFSSEHALIRLDMSEYSEGHTASRLIGAPPGYTGFQEGGQLTEVVRHRPHSLVLFDEIEKAHSDVFNVMLQILDDGRLTDGKGQTVDFKNTLIIMTSNIGHNSIIKGEDDNIVKEELKQHFKPEFLNRLDEIIVFNQLSKMDVKQIADLMLEQVCERMKAKDMELAVTCKFRDHVVERGYDPSYGARPLRRTISRLLEDALADKMLTKEIMEGDSIMVDINSEGSVVVLNQKHHSMGCIKLNPDTVVVGGKSGKEIGVSCSLMNKVFNLLSHRSSP